MNTTASLQNAVPLEAQDYKAEFYNSFSRRLEKQHPVVRALHEVLRVASYIALFLPIPFMAVALYHTGLWAVTGSFTSLGQATYLPLAWVNFGLSCSFIVFPWGLDAMMLRAFPTNAFLQTVHGRLTKRINFLTGPGAFFAGLGILCAGAPGAVHMYTLASQALQNLF
jgi:hypothetical protein